MKHRVTFATILYISVIGAVFLLQRIDSDLAVAEVSTAVQQMRDNTYPATIDHSSREEVLSGRAIKLRIPRLLKELDVNKGSYDPYTQSWILSKDTVHYSDRSQHPNNSTGMSFLYGHNTEPVLGGLEKLIDGDLIEVSTDNGLIFAYRYSGYKLVDPTDVSVLSDHTGSPTLIIMSCAGNWNQLRRAVYFDFVSVRDT